MDLERPPLVRFDLVDQLLGCRGEELEPMPFKKPPEFIARLARKAAGTHQEPAPIPHRPSIVPPIELADVRVSLQLPRPPLAIDQSRGGSDPRNMGQEGCVRRPLGVHPARNRAGIGRLASIALVAVLSAGSRRIHTANALELEDQELRALDPPAGTWQCQIVRRILEVAQPPLAPDLSPMAAALHEATASVKPGINYELKVHVVGRQRLVERPSPTPQKCACMQSSRPVLQQIPSGPKQHLLKTRDTAVDH